MLNAKKILFSDWLIGLVLTLVLLGAYLIEWRPLLALEYMSYDFRARLMADNKPQSPVVIVAIDDKSIAELGRWPWPRKLMAEFIEIMTRSQARVVGLDVFYSEPMVDPGQMEIGSILAFIDTLPNFEKNSQLMQVYDELMSSEQRLNNDAILSKSITDSGRVVLPFLVRMGEKLDAIEVQFPPFAEANSLKPAASGLAETAVAAEFPIEDFSGAAMGLGHDNLFPDSDGRIRRSKLLVEFGGRVFPSFALQSALRYLNFTPSDIQLGDGISFGKIHIPTDKNQDMLIRFKGDSGTFNYYSLSDVFDGNVGEEVFKDKIVLVGLVGTGLSTSNVTPMGHNFPAIEILANNIDNILNREFLRRPSWANKAELAAIILFGLFLSFVASRFKAFLSAVITVALMLIWNAAAVYMFVSNGMWVMMVPPTLLLGLGYTIIVSKRFMVTEKSKEKVEAASIETNKMLGLSFQSQGMLDLALDKFMKVPLEEEGIKDHLYNLALDFERKRMFNKAVSVYEHISKDGDYKDIKQKIEKLTKVGDTMIFGGTLGASKKDATVVVDGSGGDVTTPTLGRYEVQRELGRGAMGTVYLGKDPKINRLVAIKTVRFDEVDPSMIKEIKERFFREAEAAGKLAHPNIVTIYDAGEDYDLAYVAMELLDGQDLSEYVQKLGKRMPVKMAIQIVGQVAGALDYAHKNGVVHRDIKPANIMLLKRGGAKVTDFGIARVMESSKTQTGVVLGTPSYMSPEQVVGKKVDGRSDLFSLGVMFYELISGQKPFGGDSIATLMYNIANAPHAQVKEVAPDVPDCCAAIANKMLEKDMTKRYQTGALIVRDLMACYKSLG